MKHIMCVRLRRWPIDRVTRRSPRRRRRDAPPLVLVRAVAARHVVVHACPAALAHGARPGLTLAEARALCPHLAHADHDPTADRRGIEALARWMTLRFSPTVAVEPPDALLLDVTGSERLFGGMERLAALVNESVAGLGLAHRTAIAPTPGAAWAVASYGGGDGPLVLPADQLEPALHPLPAAALRLGDDLTAALHGLGVETIGQLVRLPRDVLPARFGTTILTRIDQAFGRTAEPLLAVTTAAPVRAGMAFEGVVDSLEVIWAALKHLLGRVTPALARIGHGARTLQVEFRCEDAAPVQKTISLSRPTRDARVLFNLLQSAVETAGARSGFVGVRLSVPASERVTDEQLDLLDRERQVAGAELDDLLQRLRVRLGEGAVLAARLAEAHPPERSCAFEQIDRLDPRPHADAAARDRPLKARPLHLLAAPVEVRCMLAPSVDGDGPPLSFARGRAVHYVTRVSGPERIAGVWWEGRDKTRDYYDAEDATGRRFWLFRVVETGKWYLHGVFDC